MWFFFFGLLFSLKMEDILLLLVALETLLCLTAIGGRACQAIAEKANGAIDALVSLLTTEAQSYGSRACILMRVIETTTTTTVPVDGEGNEEEGTSTVVSAVPVVKSEQLQQLQQTPAASNATPQRNVTGRVPVILQQPGQTMSSSSPVPSLVLKSAPVGPGRRRCTRPRPSRL